MNTFLFKFINLAFKKTYKLIIVIAIPFVVLTCAPRVVAATTFSDSFNGGYNTNLWYVYTNSDTTIPVSSPFGIGDTNSNIDVWYRLRSTVTPLPSDEIVKIDTKINTHPSEIVLSCKDLENNFPANEKRVYLHNNGSFSFDTYINGGGYSTGAVFTYDNSRGIHHLELDCFNTTMTFKEDNVSLGTSDDGYSFAPDTIRLDYKSGDSEFSNYQLCDINDCNEPTPTPSPTPSPTLTPTPTPTPIPTTKIVVIPGMGASWNPDAILGCKTTNYSGTWGPFPHFGDMYNPVESKLQKNGLTPHVFYYDWRQPIPTNGQSLAQFISTFVVPNERIDMLAHSMGGLVGSAYLEHAGTNNVIDRFLSVGTPYQGSILAYPAWSAGIVWDNDMMIRIASTLVLHFCSEKSVKDNRTVLQTLIPSFQNILPTFPYLYKEHSTTPIPLTSMQTKNNWLPQHTLKSPFFGVTIGLLSGTGFNTLDSLVVRPPNIFEKYLGDWIDGAPVKKHVSNNGDGTVLQSSVTIDGATNTTIHQTHSGLITSTQGIQNIVSFFTPAVLMQQNIVQQTPSPDESALVIIGYPGHFTVTDPTGLVTNDSQNIVALPNPNNGTHTLRLNPSSDETRIIVAQFLSNGKTLWNEYKDKGRQPRSHKLFFNKDNPKDNPLE